MREHVLYDQMNRASCLMLLVGMVATWNTVYLDRAVSSLGEHDMLVPTEYLPHISPLRWGHIKRFGEYMIDLETIPPPLQPDKTVLSTAAVGQPAV